MRIEVFIYLYENHEITMCTLLCLRATILHHVALIKSFPPSNTSTHHHKSQRTPVTLVCSPTCKQTLPFSLISFAIFLVQFLYLQFYFCFQSHGITSFAHSNVSMVSHGSPNRIPPPMQQVSDKGPQNLLHHPTKSTSQVRTIQLAPKFNHLCHHHGSTR